MPDNFVFPGGSLDQQDRSLARLPLPRLTRSHAGQTQTCEKIVDPLAHAALRETKEETGLNICHDAAKHMNFIGRAITPSGSPIRFHARFFSLSSSFVSGSLDGDGELSELHWPTIHQALTLPIIDVTEHMLKETLRRFKEGSLSPETGKQFCSSIYIYRKNVPTPRFYKTVT